MNRPFRFLLRAFGVLAIAAGASFAGAAWWLAQPLPLPTTPFEFDVKTGATLKSVARELAAQGVLPSDLPLVALARWRGVDRTIKAGNYEIAAGITLPHLLDKLTQGDVTQLALTIVEKETGRPADRPLVASVLVNRLRAGMRLQADPTVIYGLGAAFDGNLRKRDLEADAPYNTYVREGLPPTPIALPSLASIEAAVNPPRTDYLYFVARGDGTSVFSSNLAEHNRAVAKFQKATR